MYSTELKIKRLSLAAEARIIRTEEKRMKARRKADTLQSLHSHRKGVVRPAARVAHLAHAYLRGIPYAKVEDPQRLKSRPIIDWMDCPSICANLRTFGGKQFSQMDKKDLFRAVANWIDGGAPVGIEASNPQAAGSTPAAVATN